MTTFTWILVGAGLILSLFLFSQSIWKPIRWIGYGLFKVALGGVLLFIFNGIGGHYDFTIPINPVTAAASGLLGLPGMVSLVVIKAFIM